MTAPRNKSKPRRKRDIAVEAFVYPTIGVLIGYTIYYYFFS